MAQRHFIAFIILATFLCGCSPGQTISPNRQFSRDQQLIIAAFKLDADRVNTLLADGANVNARFGIYDQHILEDMRSLASRPSALIGGLRGAGPFKQPDRPAPQPSRPTENTVEALSRARGTQDNRPKVDRRTQ